MERFFILMVGIFLVVSLILSQINLQLYGTVPIRIPNSSVAEVTPNSTVAEVQKPHNLNATRNVTLEYESESDRYVLLQGSEESTGVKITEYKNDTFRPVSGMNIKIVIKYPSGNNSEIIGHTDKVGIYSYKWIISEDGVFMVDLYAEKSGYSPLSKHYSFTAYPDKDAYIRYSGYNDLSLR